MNDTQLLKGILEGCLLKIAEQEETYGYLAVERMREAGFDVNEATVYPILVRLQNKGMLGTEKRPSALGPDRKYYTLTLLGREALIEFKKTWEKISEIVNHIMEENGNDEEK